MFTGIVEEIGTVRDTVRNRLVVEARGVLDGTRMGDSISVNGVCLTVASLENHGFTVNVMPETLRRTNLGELRYGDQVNLERALLLGGRLGGHLVLGHVDGTGEVMSVVSEEDARIVRVGAPDRLMRYIVDKGFIAVDGVSLTIADLDDVSFAVSLVTYTMGSTTFGGRRTGDIVNLEVDILAKYVERLKGREEQRLTPEFLGEYGFKGAVDVG
ncbi:MAG: riboflavin synthase subunit alpha [Dehalococcoidia bacterium SG8_51_3]|nr:MAG: riboflavin synthase subunit alpha [Dehalococcoidia bacterium SG8_51_3]